MDDLHQPILWWHEVRVEDGNEFAGGGLKACVQRSRFVAVTILAMHIDDGVAESAVPLHHLSSHFLGLVGGVVEHLDLETVVRILHVAAGLKQAVDHELLIEDGQLYRYARQFAEVSGGVTSRFFLFR